MIWAIDPDANVGYGTPASVITSWGHHFGPTGAQRAPVNHQAIQHPRVMFGEGFDFVLPENMVCSMHPHFMNQERTHALYFQETYRVGRDGGEALSGVPFKVYQGGETEF